MPILRPVSSCKCSFHILHFLHYSTATSTYYSYAKYLVDSLGFTHQQALSISAKLTRRRKYKVIDSNFVANANSAVTLFLNLGFHLIHIRNIVSKEPLLLASKVDSTLKPKIRALQDDDFSAYDIIRVISRHPVILRYGLESTILPAIHILKQVMGSVSNVVNAIQRFTRRHFHPVVRCLLPNVALLTSYGVPINLIRRQLLHQPGYFVRNPKVFKDIVMRTDKKLGIAQRSTTKESSTSATDSYAKYMMDSMGFSRQQALSISTNLTVRRKNKVIDSKFADNANSVVTLFYYLGFDDTLLRHVVSKEPRLLASDVDKTLKPKIRSLQDAGFSLPDIIRVISWRPTILCLGLESTILPAVQILKEVMGSVSNVVNIIERLRKWHFHAISGCLLPNVTLLTSYGVPIELIRKHMLHQPGYYVQNPQVFKDVVMRVETKLGITRDSPMFLYGINLFSGMSEETFESKCRMFKSFGWTQSDLETLIIKNAYCFTSSEETIKRKLNFLMTELQLKPAYLKSRTGFITRSLEKTIVPRHKILMILKEKGLLKTTPSLYSAIYRSEPCFLKRFVLPFKEVHQDYAKLIGLKMQNQESSDVSLMIHSLIDRRWNMKLNLVNIKKRYSDKQVEMSLKPHQKKNHNRTEKKSLPEDDSL